MYNCPLVGLGYTAIVLISTSPIPNLKQSVVENSAMASFLLDQLDSENVGLSTLIHVN